MFAVDTNCMIAAVCDWHEHHQTAAAAVNRRFGGGARLTVPGPALVETYAVLTRLPAPRRMSPKDAWALIEANFVLKAVPVALSSDEYVTLLRRIVSQGIAGGRTDDAMIAACARKAGAQELLTLNRRHFEESSGGMRVIDPTG